MWLDEGRVGKPIDSIKRRFKKDIATEKRRGREGREDLMTKDRYKFDGKNCCQSFQPQTESLGHQGQVLIQPNGIVELSALIDILHCHYATSTKSKTTAMVCYDAYERHND